MDSINISNRMLELSLKKAFRESLTKIDIMIAEYKLRAYDLTPKEREYLEFDVKMDKLSINQAI